MRFARLICLLAGRHVTPNGHDRDEWTARCERCGAVFDARAQGDADAEMQTFSM